MSHQLTFTDSEFSSKRRQTRKEIFLSRMEQILPWQDMTAVIEPFYPKAGNISDAEQYDLGSGKRVVAKEGRLAKHWQKRCENRERLDRNRLSEVAQRLYKGRQETVERSFADAKQHHGHRYARSRHE